MCEDLLKDPLPEPWSFGVTQHGRIFFINDDEQTTTWLHPITKQAVMTGYQNHDSLPEGWQKGYTATGEEFYIDHHNKLTTFKNPTKAEEKEKEEKEDKTKRKRIPSFTGSLTRPFFRRSTSKSRGGTENKRSSRSKDRSEKVSYSRSSSISRRSSLTSLTGSKGMKIIAKRKDGEIIKQGWLYKQSSSSVVGGGLKTWRKRWFLLSDLCLFYYKDADDKQILGSIILPSYTVETVASEDKISRKYSFKIHHPGMRTFYISAESYNEMAEWIQLLSSICNLEVSSKPDSEKKKKDKKKKKDVKLTEQEKEGGFDDFNDLNVKKNTAVKKPVENVEDAKKRTSEKNPSKSEVTKSDEKKNKPHSSTQVATNENIPNRISKSVKQVRENQQNISNNSQRFHTLANTKSVARPTQQQLKMPNTSSRYHEINLYNPNMAFLTNQRQPPRYMSHSQATMIRSYQPVDSRNKQMALNQWVHNQQNGNSRFQYPEQAASVIGIRRYEPRDPHRRDDNMSFVSLQPTRQHHPVPAYMPQTQNSLSVKNLHRHQNALMQTHQQRYGHLATKSPYQAYTVAKSEIGPSRSNYQLSEQKGKSFHDLNQISITNQQKSLSNAKILSSSTNNVTEHHVSVKQVDIKKRHGENLIAFAISKKPTEKAAVAEIDGTMKEKNEIQSNCKSQHFQDKQSNQYQIDLKRLQDINKSTNLMQDQIQEVESKSHLTRKEIEESISLSDTDKQESLEDQLMEGKHTLLKIAKKLHDLQNEVDTMQKDYRQKKSTIMNKLIADIQSSDLDAELSEVEEVIKILSKTKVELVNLVDNCRNASRDENVSKAKYSESSIISSKSETLKSRPLSQSSSKTFDSEVFNTISHSREPTTMKSAASVDNLTAAAFQFNTLRSSTLKRPQTSDGKSARERLLSSKSQSNLVEPHEVKRIQHEIQQGRLNTLSNTLGRRKLKPTWASEIQNNIGTDVQKAIKQHRMPKVLQRVKRGKGAMNEAKSSSTGFDFDQFEASVKDACNTTEKQKPDLPAPLPPPPNDEDLLEIESQISSNVDYTASIQVKDKVEIPDRLIDFDDDAVPLTADQEKSKQEKIRAIESMLTRTGRPVLVPNVHLAASIAAEAGSVARAVAMNAIQDQQNKLQASWKSPDSSLIFDDELETSLV